MTIEQQLKQAIQQAFFAMGQELKLDQIVIERSKEKIHGDFATNVAMQMARIMKKSPKSIAEELMQRIKIASVERMEVAGPGFLNFFIKQESLNSLIHQIIEEKEKYGCSDYGKGKKINVEFVSANPTGDLHLGHTRGAALGDSICRLYQAIGYDVTREFYVNDAGNQILNLAKSIDARYQEEFGNTAIHFPEDGYHGEDVKMIARKIKEEIGDKYLHGGEEAMDYFRKRGTELELEKLRKDLEDFRVTFDVFSSELAIRNRGEVDQILKKLEPYTYNKDGAVFLKTTDFGDDKDRVIIKKDGSYTYLLPDIAYHNNKLSRGFSLLVDCLGADHHGYISRMKAALQILGYSPDILEIELIQMVRLFKDGAEYKMSKRTGNAISMRELCDEVGVDAVRYFFVSRAASSHLDFDLDLASKMESSNPVFYAQYAHARLSKVLEIGKAYTLDYDGKLLHEEKEKELLKILELFPKEVENAALSRAPYKITNYIQKLATAIHEFYTVCRVVDENNKDLTSSRLGLCKAAKQVMKNALELIGVHAPERM